MALFTARRNVMQGNHTLETFLQNLQFCDRRAWQDIRAVKTLHDKVVEVLNPMVRDQKSVKTLHEELASLQSLLEEARQQFHVSQSRAAWALEKLSEMEALLDGAPLQEPGLAKH